MQILDCAKIVVTTSEIQFFDQFNRYYGSVSDEGVRDVLQAISIHEMAGDLVCTFGADSRCVFTPKAFICPHCGGSLIKHGMLPFASVKVCSKCGVISCE